MSNPASMIALRRVGRTPRRRLTKEELAVAKEMFEEGDSTSEVARALKISIRTSQLVRRKLLQMDGDFVLYSPKKLGRPLDRDNGEEFIDNPTSSGTRSAAGTLDTGTTEDMDDAADSTEEADCIGQLYNVESAEQPRRLKVVSRPPQSNLDGTTAQLRRQVSRVQLELRNCPLDHTENSRYNLLSWLLELNRLPLTHRLLRELEIPKELKRLKRFYASDSLLTKPLDMLLGKYSQLLLGYRDDLKTKSSQLCASFDGAPDRGDRGEAQQLSAQDSSVPYHSLKRSSLARVSSSNADSGVPDTSTASPLGSLFLRPNPETGPECLQAPTVRPNSVQAPQLTTSVAVTMEDVFQLRLAMNTVKIFIDGVNEKMQQLITGYEKLSSLWQMIEPRVMSCSSTSQPWYHEPVHAHESGTPTGYGCAPPLFAMPVDQLHPSNVDMNPGPPGYPHPEARAMYTIPPSASPMQHASSRMSRPERIPSGISTSAAGGCMKYNPYPVNPLPSKETCRNLSGNSNNHKSTIHVSPLSSSMVLQVSSSGVTEPVSQLVDCDGETSSLPAEANEIITVKPEPVSPGTSTGSRPLLRTSKNPVELPSSKKAEESQKRSWSNKEDPHDGDDDDSGAMSFSQAVESMPLSPVRKQKMLENKPKYRKAWTEKCKKDLGVKYAPVKQNPPGKGVLKACFPSEVAKEAVQQLQAP